MKNQLLQQLRQLLARNGLDGESSTVLILVLLILARRHAGPDEGSLNLSPLRLMDEVASIAEGLPEFQHAFVERGVLKRLEPMSLTLAVDLARQLLASADGRIPVAALPALLDHDFAFDPGVAHLVAQLVNPSKGQLVYVPWETTGQFSAALADMGAQAFVETPGPSLMIRLMGMLGTEPWQIRQADPIFDRDNDVSVWTTTKFEAAASFPPMGAKIDLQRVNTLPQDLFPERTSSIAVLAIRQLLASTHGRVVVAVPNNVLFSAGAEYSLRKDLLTKRVLKAVIAMPGGLFSRGFIPFTLLVLDSRGGSRQVRFVNADMGRFKSAISRTRIVLSNIDELVGMANGEIEGPEVKSVDIDALSDAQLQVHRHVVPDTVVRAREIVASSETIALDDLVTVIRPALLMSDKDAESCCDALFGVEAPTAFEVGAADLPKYGYITQPGRRVTLDPKARVENQFLRSYDILVITKGSTGKVGIVPAMENTNDQRWVAGQSAIVLRTRDSSKFDPRALFMQLRSPLGQELLKGIVAGSVIPMIQLKELRDLHVVLPDVETQQQAIEVLNKEASYEHGIAVLRAQQAALAADLWQLD